MMYAFQVNFCCQMTDTVARRYGIDCPELVIEARQVQDQGNPRRQDPRPALVIHPFRYSKAQDWPEMHHEFFQSNL